MLPGADDSAAEPPLPLRTYEVRTYGCQMNVHDSERLSGVLEAAGYRVRGDEEPPADVVVFNTCAVRENADNRLYGNLGHLRSVKRAHPGMQIAVGGCLAQKDREHVLRRAPWVDVVFGTHNIAVLPVLLQRARVLGEAQIEIVESLERFPSSLPGRRSSAHSAWVAISVGCNNTCSFCIVPQLRGVEKDRRPAEILAEIEALVADGVVEVTLLGQNVNSYGVQFGDRAGFAELLRACGQIPGLRRVRFTSPHPRDFTNDVLTAMAETPVVMPHLHLPLQSGSDAILRAMRRSYRASRYLTLVADARRLLPTAALTTDIIVGFPGESEADFEATLGVVDAAAFDGAYTFRYSPRPGTDASTMPGQVPPEVVQERYLRLTDRVDAIACARNEAFVGRRVEVMMHDVAPGQRLTGRARDGRLVHLADPGVLADGERLRAGDLVTVAVTHGAPHHLLADAQPEAVVRTGPSSAALAPADAPTPAGGGALSVDLGMPRRPG